MNSRSVLCAELSICSLQEAGLGGDIESSSAAALLLAEELGGLVPDPHVSLQEVTKTTREVVMHSLFLPEG